jgi:hypothetical protein
VPRLRKKSPPARSRKTTPVKPAGAGTEADLYAPVRDFLVAQGFVVRAEVNGCDVAGVRGDDLVIVELKRGLTIDLLLQAVKRQRLTDAVYVAVPRPGSSAAEARLREMLPLLRRLEVGLLVVDTRFQPPTLAVAQQPLPVQRRRQAAKRRALLVEFARRSGDDNTGGSTRRPLVTAYRENALLVALALSRLGPSKPRALRALGTGPRTLSILSRDVYGWFEHADRALYRLRPAGEEALQTWANVVGRVAGQLKCPIG